MNVTATARVRNWIARITVGALVASALVVGSAMPASATEVVEDPAVVATEQDAVPSPEAPEGSESDVPGGVVDREQQPPTESEEAPAADTESGNDPVTDPESRTSDVLKPEARLAPFAESTENESSISGTVTFPVGTQTSGDDTYVQAYVVYDDWSDYVAESWVSSDGTFTIDALAPGDYQLRVITRASDVAGQWWDGASGSRSATTITLDAGESHTGVPIALTRAASISGTVALPTGSEPDDRVSVAVYTEHREWVTGADTDEDGTYRVTGLAPGEYKVRFDSWDGDALSQWWDGAADFESAQSMIVSEGDHVTGIDATLTKAASISGVVTFPAGTDLDQGSTEVRIVPANDEWGVTQYATVAADGTYRASGLTAGDYKVQFSSWNRDVLDQWWAGTADFDSAAVVTLGDGESRTGIDASLAQGASISGVVTFPDGVDADSGELEATAYRATDDDGYDYVASATVAGDGSYTIRGLESGVYKVRFGSSGPDVVGQWWEAGTDFASATPITLDAGEARTGVNVTLAKAASISGVVTFPDGVDAESGELEATAYRATDDDDYDYAASATVAGDGSYTIRGLQPGVYKVFFGSWGLDVIGQWWEAGTDFASATPITVDAGEVRTGVDVALAKGASISGVVTFPDGVDFEQGHTEVRVVDANDERGSERYASVAEDGSYRVTGLSAGAYKVQFDSWGRDVLDQWWEDAADFASASTITLGPGQAHSGVDVTLAKGASISGTVTFPEGVDTAEGYTDAYVYRSTGDGGYEEVGNGWVASDGTYAVRGLAAGSYKLQFQSWDRGVLNEWWEDQTDFDSATTITLEDGEARAGVDATLDVAGSISGTLTTAGDQPASDTDVEVYRYDAGEAAWDHWGSTATDSEGRYTAGGLAPGAYRVWFNPAYSGVDALAEWWDDAATLETASTIEVAVGANVTGIDGQLAAGGSIVGTVRTEDGAPVSGAEVSIRRFDASAEWWERIREARTDENGEFAVRGLASGEYKVQISTFEADQNVAGEWWQDAETLAAAAIVTVVAGGAPVEIAPRLSPGSRLSGVVTDEADVPLADVYVTAYRLTGAGDWDWAGDTVTTADGTYLITGLPAGTYRLEYSVWAVEANVVGEWWEDAYSAETATSITIVTGESRGNLDVKLADGGSIEGRMTDGAGAPLVDGYVTAWRQADSGGWDYVKGASTNGDGFYALSGLRTGAYALSFSAWVPEGQLAEWWENKASRAEADLVDVVAGGPVGRYNVVLDEDDGSTLETYSASISGKVTDASGAPLGGVSVEFGSDSEGGDTVTAPDGTYSFNRWAAGDYHVRFDGGPDYAVVWWNGAASREQASTLSLASGESRTDINATLTRIDEFVTGTATIDNGAPRVGDVLTAGAPGWEAGTAFTYQWRADGADIPSATTPNLEVGATLLGKAIRVVVTGTKSGHAPVERESVVTAAVAAGTLTASVPTIAGTAKLGSTLTASPGMWTVDTALTYRWQADDVLISGATASTFVPTAAQVGKTITVTVTGSLAGYTSASRTSEATTAVAAGTLTAPTPTIAGVAKNGSRLTAAAGSWTSGTKLTYQWNAGGSVIAGATASTFTPGASQVGKTITVTVTGSLAGYVTASRTSTPTAKVAALALKSATPIVSGTAAVGSKLTVKPGSWTAGAKFSYQWFADGKAISKATKSSFTLTTSQKAKKITVKVTGAKAGYTTVVKSSKATVKVATVAVPKISGTAKVGKKLTAKPGTWTAGTKLSYQWYANGKAISKATKSTLTLKAAQKGKTITVKVTGKRSGYATVSKTSKATKKVG